MHFAAWLAVSDSVRDPVGYYRNNVLGTLATLEAMAAEWAGQSEFIIPASMPLTQLAFAAVDHTPDRRDTLIAYIAKFGETDLVCHRAASPAPLVARQSTLWDPMIVWAAHDLGVVLPVVTGVVAAVVPAESTETLASSVPPRALSAATVSRTGPSLSAPYS